MDFLKKSMVLRIVSILLATFVVLAGVTFFVGTPLAERFDPLVLILLGFFLLILVACLAFFFIVHQPLSAIFREMKSLLTGHSYKKIFTTRIDEVGVLAHFFNDVTKNIERIAVDVAEGKRMSKELSIGSDIQRKILPKEMPKIVGMEVFGNTRPASEVGGDSFDFIQTPQQQTMLYVGDVTGHGLPAALIMIMVNTLIRTFSELHASTYDIIVNTNRILKSRIEPRRFMTCVLLRWNPVEKKLYYTGAGHEHILIYHKKEGFCEVRQTGGIALGMVPDVTKIVKEEQIPFELGDFVVLYSDGIIEAKNMQGQMFGVTRLKEEVEQVAKMENCTPEFLFTTISKNFGQFVGDQIQEDDITLIGIKRV